MEKTLCSYDKYTRVWKCGDANWEIQHGKCQYSFKSASRNHCMHLCNDMRCDNWQAQPTKDE